MLKIRYKLLVLGIFGFVLLGCKENSKNENLVDDMSSPKSEKSTNNTSSSKTQKKTGAYATINFDDGRIMEMEARRQQGLLSLPNKFEGNMTDYKVIVMIELKDSEPLQDKTYEKGAYLSISNMQGNIPLEEEYRSYHNNKADDKQGNAEIKITSISKTHAEGTFKGTLYSLSNKKAVIEGRFITSRKE